MKSIQYVFSVFHVGGLKHDLVQQKDVTSCVPCPAKFYCPEGSDLRPIPCPKGFYCLEGQTSGFQHPCPGGGFQFFVIVIVLFCYDHCLC